MKRYSGQEKVAGGYYWSLGRWEIVTVRGKVGVLPGHTDEKYAELPLPAIPIVVVLMASMNMFFVPAIGFLMVVYALYLKATGKAGGVAKVASGAELPKG